MTLRGKIILIMIFILGAILVIFGVVKLISFVKSAAPETKTEVPVKESNTPLYNPNPTPPPIAEVKHPPVYRTEEPAEAKISAFARPFVERLGSYSNQSDFENLQDLLLSMTPSMQSWAQTQIAEAKAKPFQKQYRGTTTRALAVKIESIDEALGTATVRVSAQRTETIGDKTNARTYVQDCLLQLKKTNGVWVADSAKWE